MKRTAAAGSTPKTARRVTKAKVRLARVAASIVVATMSFTPMPVTISLGAVRIAQMTLRIVQVILRIVQAILPIAQVILPIAQVILPIAQVILPIARMILPIAQGAFRVVQMPESIARVGRPVAIGIDRLVLTPMSLLLTTFREPRPGVRKAKGAESSFRTTMRAVLLAVSIAQTIVSIALSTRPNPPMRMSVALSPGSSA